MIPMKFKPTIFLLLLALIPAALWGNDADDTAASPQEPQNQIQDEIQGQVQSEIQGGKTAEETNAWKEELSDRIQEALQYKMSLKPRMKADSLWTHPDFILYIPKMELDKLGDAFNDVLMVFDKPNGKLFSVSTQATCEGAPDQHLIFMKSEDQGKTWSAPKLLQGPRIMSDPTPIASWGFPIVTRSGRIYILYNQYIPGKVSVSRQQTGVMAGIYSDDDGETWSEPEIVSMPRTSLDHPDTSIPAEWVPWQKPTRLAKDGKYLLPITRTVAEAVKNDHWTVCEFVRFENIDDDPPVAEIQTTWLNTDEKVLSVKGACEEASVVKLPDGRLFTLMRTDSGSPVWSVSGDQGESWTKPEPLRFCDGGEIVLHPTAPCPIYDWKGSEAGSGLYFAFVHNYFDFSQGGYQKRGPLYLLAGRFDPNAHQPIRFDAPKLFTDRPEKQAFYSSVTYTEGKTILWYPDCKTYLLGRVIGPEWLEDVSSNDK